jgi:hypothetical protein
MELPALEITRGSDALVVRWGGSPHFRFAILATVTAKVAFMHAAESMEQDARRHTGWAQKEIEACVRHLRMLAAREP